MTTTRVGLWHQLDFLKLWFGQTLSDFGSHITREALPIMAVVVLSASPAQMSVLAAASALPVLLLSFVAGWWVDRFPRRPVMLFADAGRLLLLLLIPVAAVSGHLTMTLLYVIAAGLGVLGLFFGLAYRSILPSLVHRDDLLEANTKLATTEALAEIGGPSLAGMMVQAFTAPLAVVFDAVSYVYSLVSIGSMRHIEVAPEPASEDSPVLSEIAAGARYLMTQPVLRALALTMGWRSFFGNFFAALYALYALRELGLTPALLGLVVSAGGIGSLLGVPLAGRLPRRFGLGKTLTVMALGSALIGLLTPLAQGMPVVIAAGMLIAGQIFGDACQTVFGINEISLRQLQTPTHLLGRVNATMEFIGGGVAPLGALVGGLLAETIGTRGAIWVAVLGILASALYLWLFSAVRHAEYPAGEITE